MIFSWPNRAFRSANLRRHRRLPTCEHLMARRLLVATLLVSTFDDAAAIASPIAGIGGSSNLSADDFRPAVHDSGAHFAGNRVASFPVQADGYQNFNAEAGEVDFWYQPEHAAAEDDITRVLVGAGRYYDVPRMTLVESDTLSLTFTNSSWQSYRVAAPWRADLWQAGDWVHIRGAWDFTSSEPTMWLYVNDTLVAQQTFDEVDVPQFPPQSQLFVGAADGSGLFSAEGTIDQFVVRDGPTTSQPVPTPPQDPDPLPPPQPDPPQPAPDPRTDPTAVLPVPTLARPAVGSWTYEPTFGTYFTRLSDSSERSGFETHDYSQLQPFSSDSRHVLLGGSRGYRVLRLDGLQELSHLDTSHWNAPRWLPNDPNKILHFDSNADRRVRIQQTDIRTGTTEDLLVLPERYPYVRVSPSFEELSRDGRWMAGMVTRDDGATVIFTADLAERRLALELPVDQLYAGHCQPDPVWGAFEPDWVGVSPLGQSLVIQWPRDGIAACSGMETYDLETGEFIGRAYDGHQHSDLGVLPETGEEFVMTFEMAGPAPRNGDPAISIRMLPGEATASPPQYLQSMDWGNTEHISCQGPDGTCLVTAGSLESNGWNPFEQEIFLQNTDGSVQRLIHHRSSSCGYWAQPRASMSRDGRYVIFASDWGQHLGASCSVESPLGQVDPYLIDLWHTEPPEPQEEADVPDSSQEDDAPQAAPPYDVDGSGLVTPLDVLMVIQAINGKHAASRDEQAKDAYWETYDIDGNGLLSPIDAMLIINHIQRRSETEANNQPSDSPSAEFPVNFSDPWDRDRLASGASSF